MDFQGLLEGGWPGLEDVTLFPNDQLELLNVEDFLHTPIELPSKHHNEKSNSDLSSIWDEWMDEKFDLSTFALQNDWMNPQIDSIKISEEDATAILESLVDYNLSTKNVTPVTNVVEATKYFENSEGVISSNTSADISLPSPPAIVPEILLESPNISSEEIPQSPISSPASSICNSYYEFSPESENVENDVFVENDSSCFVLDSKDMEKAPIKSAKQRCEPCMNQASTKASLRRRLHPNSVVPYTKAESRKERKKVQNKEAAARYREKRRLQDLELCGEVSELEAKGKELREKHDQLKNEVSYLKSLMREMFQKRGLLK